MSNSSSTLEAPVAQSFQPAFPTIASADVPLATTSNTRGWNSLARIALVSVISKTPGVEVDFEAFESTVSSADAVEAARQAVPAS